MKYPLFNCNDNEYHIYFNLKRGVWEERFCTLDTQKPFCGIGSYYQSKIAYAKWST